jgi:Polyphosphate kinase 2 (PPK2)
MPSTSNPSSSSCRRSTPVARTARSITCSAHSIRKACVSLPSNSPPRLNSPTTSCGASIPTLPEEQLQRFAQRLDDPARNWKISESDYSERALWDDYIEAFEDAIRATSTREAPWYVIPSNHKWFRNLAVSQIMADTMADLGLAFPAPSVNLADIRRKYHAAVKEEKGNRKKA